jgi:1-acyl-sn-glycerol-3-phosphate acyltransferase
MIIRSALFNIVFWVWTFTFGLLCLPIALIYHPFSFTVARIWALGSLWFLRTLCNIRYEIKGREYIPQGASLVASKHQSAWDTLIFWTLLKKPSYVLKRELLFFPVFGLYLILLKCIYINRKSGASTIKHMMRKAEDEAAKGRAIVIYPEGTRTPPGSISVYHPGVAALYQRLELPVVPVALNSGLLWKKDAFVKTPGLITLEFLPPIAPGMKGRDFLKKLQEIIEQKTSELIKQ